MAAMTILTCFSAGVRADESDPLASPVSKGARAHLIQGNRLYAVREFDRAIVEYKSGALLEDAPVFQYNLAQAYRMLGHYKDALWHYDRFVKRTNPTGQLREAIERFVAQMNAELSRAATREPPVEIGGSAVASVGKPNRVTATSRETHAWRKWLWAGAGSAALASVAVGFKLWGDTTYDRAKRSMDQAKRDELEGSANRRLIYSQVAAGAAAVGAGLSVYLYLSRARNQAPRSAGLHPWVAPNHAGVAWSGVW